MKKNKKKIIMGIGVSLALFLAVFSFINLRYPTKINAYIAHAINKAAPANTSFTDENFYNAVVDAYNKENSTSLPYTTRLTDTQLASIKEVSHTGSTYFDVIKNVNGLEKMTSLTKLILAKEVTQSNSLGSVDLSKNIELTYLDLSSDSLTSIDLSKNTKLKYLNLNGNALTNINLSKNTELTSLYLDNNALTNVDVSMNTKLTQLSMGNANENVGDNALTSINLDNNLNLTYLDIERNKLTNINLSKNTLLTEVILNGNNISSINISNNSNLTKLELGSNRLTNIDLSKSAALTKLGLARNSLTNVDLSNNTALTELNMGINQLTNIDLSKNAKLTKLDLGQNKLISIDLGKNTQLTDLDLAENKLTGIDLSRNAALKKLYLHNNPFTYKAYIKKGNTLSNGTIKMPEGSGYYLKYNVNNSSIASVTDDTKVTGTNAGKTNVTVTLQGVLNSYDLTSTSTRAITVDGSITVYDISSTKYNINQDKKYVYTKADTEASTILSNLNLQYINGKIENNKLILYSDEGTTIDEYEIINIKSSKYDLTKEEYIYLGTNSFNSSDITVTNGTIEVNDYVLNVKYKGEVLASKKLVRVASSRYDLTKDYISDSNFNKEDITVINGTKEVKDNKLYIKYKDEILKTYVILESSTLPSGRLKGDIDNDGVINIWDVTLLYMHIRGKRVITDEEALEAGKLTGSQSVTLGDVTRLYRYIRGKIEEL